MRDEIKLYTIVADLHKPGRFPCVIIRSPYGPDGTENLSDLFLPFGGSAWCTAFWCFHICSRRLCSLLELLRLTSGPCLCPPAARIASRASPIGSVRGKAACRRICRSRPHAAAPLSSTQGFVVVQQNQRGTGDSGGNFTFWETAPADEADTIEWIVQQVRPRRPGRSLPPRAERSHVRASRLCLSFARAIAGLEQRPSVCHGRLGRRHQHDACHARAAEGDGPVVHLLPWHWPRGLSAQGLGHARKKKHRQARSPSLPFAFVQAPFTNGALRQHLAQHWLQGMQNYRPWMPNYYTNILLPHEAYGCVSSRFWRIRSVFFFFFCRFVAENHFEPR